MVVVGRVGGLFNVLLVLVRVLEATPGLVAVEDEIGRLAVVVPATGRFVVVEVAVLVFGGDTGVFSFEASGLDLVVSSPPDITVDSTGVAGGAFSRSTSDGTGTGSSVADILPNNVFKTVTNRS